MCVYVICCLDDENGGELQEIQLLIDLKGVIWCLLLLDLTLLISSQMQSSMYNLELFFISASEFCFCFTDQDLVISIK